MFAVNPVKSKVSFTAKQLKLFDVHGEFHAYSILLSIDQATQTITNIQAVIDGNSVDTGNRTRDRHLRRDQFFDILQFPDISFSSSKKISLNETETEGLLKIKDKSKQTILNFEVSSVKEKNTTFLRIKSTFLIDRRDFNMKALPFLVDHMVKVDVDLFFKAVKS